MIEDLCKPAFTAQRACCTGRQLRPIRVAMRVPQQFRNRASYVFKTFSLIWGIPIRVVGASDASQAEIVYGTARSDGTAGAHRVTIPFDQAGFQETTQFEAVQHNGRVLWKKQEKGGGFDVIASTYRLLGLLDEAQVDPQARDRRQIFDNGVLPLARREVDTVPIVEHHGAYLLEMLRSVAPGAAAERVPKWPGGRRFAIAITHDTDAVHAGAPLELATNLAKSVLRRDPRHFQLFTEGLRHLGDVAGNPLFGFPRWREIEGHRGVRGCFYLFANTNRTKRDLNDCKSSVATVNVPWQALRNMAAEGWEFGLHASIHAKRSVDSFLSAKHWLEEKLQEPLRGLRHHYWALDWQKPHLTFRKHVNAGFRYDTSIAWNTKEGFRAATCHPYQPFDPGYDRPLEMFELPTSIMDGYVVNQPDGLARARAILEAISGQGGVAILDWHTETAWNRGLRAGYVDFLLKMLEPYFGSSDVWFATPWEIAKHWRARAAALGERTGD